MYSCLPVHGCIDANRLLKANLPLHGSSFNARPAGFWSPTLCAGNMETDLAAASTSKNATHEPVAVPLALKKSARMRHCSGHLQGTAAALSRCLLCGLSGVVDTLASLLAV
eukprot:CAMPEP_0181443744 /NCGR_PEP_ID=MMETSP1110-20121109/24710_1 /TAXON_ID=174948 /ORGANISM="Symbiodinium sp., Strain CCMP421" /LENGTH=110 /DNA_ID=CAMNT_0023567727 /DNA_START=1118 /DNA_END=1450 /DNA_ORIENTATION=+